MNNYHLVSSMDSTKVSNMVRGAVLTSSAVLILIVGRVFDVELTALDFEEVATITAVMAGAIWTAYGAFFKLLNTNLVVKLMGAILKK